MVLAPILLAVALAGVTTVEVTGKSITDHTVSAVKGQDCRVANYFKDRAVCDPGGTVTVSAPPLNQQYDSVAVQEDLFAQRRARK